MTRAYRIWRAFQERQLQYVAAVLLLGPTLLTLVEVVRRYGFAKSFAWQQDLVIYTILSGVFLFFGITQSRNLHLRVTIVLDLLRARGGRAGPLAASGLELFGAVVGLAFCLFLVWRGLPVAERMFERNRMAESQIVPLWPFFFVFLLGIALMAVSFFFQVYAQVQRLRGVELDAAFRSEGEGAGPIL